MKKFILLAAGISVMLLPLLLQAQNKSPQPKPPEQSQTQEPSDWPRDITLKNGTVTLYQPQTDSMKGDHLYSRMAFSISLDQMKNPIFGAMWTDSKFSTDRTTGTCTIYNVKVMNIRFPGIDTVDKAKIQTFKDLLEKEATGWNIDFSLDELTASLSENATLTAKNANFKNDPPEIIYLKTPSVLVLFDGDPVWKETGQGGPKRAINTPFLVLQDTQDKNCYLYGGQYWYKAADPVKASWVYVPKPSSQVKSYFDQLKKEMEKQGKSMDQNTADKSSNPPVIIVRTKPAELIQSKGEAQFAPIEGTQLLYMTNTDNNIFMTIDKNMYYVLISGRWYKAGQLSGPWVFVESDNLPPDFAKIPEGSAKDQVLASVAGTDAARDAVLDAQIPQTAAVDRKAAKCDVKWDGDPKFEKISGTELARGMNTSSTVLLYKKTYYVCDNAVWFLGNSPTGPWSVATSIPDEIQKIPPDDPSYNVKYVYIYDVEPEVVYVGYTPGYTGCYVYGPTIVYGTGWPYPPFYGPYYYPHPVTFGFSMSYNPWYGFSMGFSMSVGMFTFSMGGFHGGWWGPPMYRPPYAMPYSHYYGAHPPAYRGGGNTINIDNSRNIYANRPDNSARPSQLPSNRPGQGGQGTRPGQGGQGTRPSTQPANRPGQGGQGSQGARPSTQPANRPGQGGGGKNNVYTDKNGDVYRNNNGEWQKNNGKDWEKAQPSDRQGGTQNKGGGTQNNGGAQNKGGTQQNRNSFNQQDMNRQSQARDRGAQNSMNRSNATRSSGGGGGGARMGGGGGRRR